MNNYSHIADERMIKVMDYVVKHQLKDVQTIKDWCLLIGFIPNNITNVRNGKQSFSNEHIRQCCIKFNVSADYIYGLTSVLFRSESKLHPIQKLEAAIAELKALKK